MALNAPTSLYRITLQTGNKGVNDSNAAMLRNVMIPWGYIYFALLPGKWVHEARETAFLEDGA